MNYVIIGLSIVFILIGLVLNKNNSKQLLSGYNEMSEAERANVDIDKFIRFFKNFHIFLGVSFLFVGLTLFYFVGENAAGIFLVFYPLLAYIYFALVSLRFGANKTLTIVSIFMLIIVAIIVIALLATGFKENVLNIENDRIKISGVYGETIHTNQIAYIKLEEELPKISHKNKGFAMEEIQKGIFRTKQDETVKLILNSLNNPYILIEKTNGKKIYFSSKNQSNQIIFEELKEVFINTKFE